MSFIFEALKKAERERRTGSEVRPVLAFPAEEGGAARPGRAWRLLLGACTVVVAGVAWVLLREPEPGPGAPPSPIQAPLAAAPEVVPEPLAPETVPLPATSERGPPRAAPTPAPALPAVVGARAAPPATRSESLPEPAPPPRPPPVPPAPPAAQAPAAVPPSEPSPPKPPEPAVPPVAAAPAPRASSPPLLLRELPAEVRERIGRLEISGHVYGEAPAERFVFLNGRAVRAGERIAAGVTLEAITPDGIVIDYGEGRARVEAAP